MTIAQGTRVKVAAGELEGQYGTVINDQLDVVLDDGDGKSTHFDIKADLLPLVLHCKLHTRPCTTQPEARP
jgi:hypothetical protein